MNTRRAFLTEMGVAASSLLLPGLAEACVRRRRCRDYYACPYPTAPRKVAAAYSYGCPMQFLGVVNGKYTYRCHCCGSDSDVPWQYCTLTDSVPHMVGDGHCSGTNCDKIFLPAYRRIYGPPEFHYSVDCVNNGNREYIDIGEKFKAEPNVLAFDVGSTDYNDGKEQRWAKLFVVVAPVQAPEHGIVTLLIGHELAPKKRLPSHWPGTISGSEGYYHSVLVNGLQYHVLTRGKRPPK